MAMLVMRNLPPLAVIVSRTFGKMRLSMIWPVISTSSMMDLRQSWLVVRGQGRRQPALRNAVEALYLGCLTDRQGQRRWSAHWLNNHTKYVMENPEAKSKWDDLVRELAVEIPPEVQQREETVASAKPPAPRSTEPGYETGSTAWRRSQSLPNWNSLVTDLGLPPIEEPETRCTCPTGCARSAEAGFAT